jgi:hypothetical protein
VILPTSANVLSLSRGQSPAWTLSIWRAERWKDYPYPETYLLIGTILVYWQSKVIFFARRCFDMKKVRNYGSTKHIGDQRLYAFSKHKLYNV